jgi:hypothetical protein
MSDLASLLGLPPACLAVDNIFPLKSEVEKSQIFGKDSVSINYMEGTLLIQARRALPLGQEHWTGEQLRLSSTQQAIIKLQGEKHRWVLKLEPEQLSIYEQVSEPPICSWAREVDPWVKKALERELGRELVGYLKAIGLLIRHGSSTKARNLSAMIARIRANQEGVWIGDARRWLAGLSSSLRQRLEQDAVIEVDKVWAHLEANHQSMHAPELSQKRDSFENLLVALRAAQAGEALGTALSRLDQRLFPFESAVEELIEGRHPIQPFYFSVLSR